MSVLMVCVSTVYVCPDGLCLHCMSCSDGLCVYIVCLSCWFVCLHCTSVLMVCVSTLYVCPDGLCVYIVCLVLMVCVSALYVCPDGLSNDYEKLNPVPGNEARMVCLG